MSNKKTYDLEEDAWKLIYPTVHWLIASGVGRTTILKFLFDWKPWIIDKDALQTIKQIDAVNNNAP